PLGAINRELLSHINILTTAVPALAWITFGILVREHTALGFHNRAAGEILRCDQLDIFALTSFLRADRVEDFRIYPAQRFAVNPRARSSCSALHLMRQT